MEELDNTNRFWGIVPDVAIRVLPTVGLFIGSFAGLAYSDELAANHAHQVVERLESEGASESFIQAEKIYEENQRESLRQRFPIETGLTIAVGGLVTLVTSEQVRRRRTKQALGNQSPLAAN